MLIVSIVSSQSNNGLLWRHASVFMTWQAEWHGLLEEEGRSTDLTKPHGYRGCHLVCLECGVHGLSDCQLFKAADRTSQTINLLCTETTFRAESSRIFFHLFSLHHRNEWCFINSVTRWCRSNLRSSVFFTYLELSRIRNVVVVVKSSC